MTEFDNFTPEPQEGVKMSEEVSSTSEAPSDETVVETADQDTHKSMLEAAHATLNGQNLSNISVNHPYWGLMNAARQFKHEKGL